MAVLYIDTNNLTKAAKEVEEALNINRERWKANPALAADDLIRSLLISIQTHQESSTKCQLAKEAVSVAYSPRLIALAKEETAACTGP
jgi:hypothetical protein